MPVRRAVQNNSTQERGIPKGDTVPLRRGFAYFRRAAKVGRPGGRNLHPAVGAGSAITRKCDNKKQNAPAPQEGEQSAPARGRNIPAMEAKGSCSLAKD
ncbi:MAG: hypothetical protein IJ072_02505 [Oscillospiraceae bacterium]|nr:hypothetical protein [Oscillospiraceae bacterium]